jgi:hypothetical protein
MVKGLIVNRRTNTGLIHPINKSIPVNRAFLVKDYPEEMP